MRASTSRRWGSKGLIAAALVLGVGAPGRADYREAYRKGIEAAGRRNWVEVARQMRAALGEQASEGEPIKLYGMRYEDYLPHYYLGLALSNAGDCEGALREWDVSQSQGAVQKSPKFKDLQKQRQSCETRLALAGKPSPPAEPSPAGPDPAVVTRLASEAEDEVGRADDAARGLAGLESDPALAPIWEREEALGPAQRQALDLLASARSKLGSGRKASDPPQLGEARGFASRAREELDRVRQAALARREARLAEARRAEEEKRRDEKKAPSPPTRPSGPPVELVQAARYYFEGRYRDAVDSLASTTYPPGPAAVQGLLFRAAARHALYLIGGKKDEEVLRAAVADVQACRRLDPSLTPDAQAFSPRFREFFRRGE